MAREYVKRFPEFGEEEEMEVDDYDGGENDGNNKPQASTMVIPHDPLKIFAIKLDKYINDLQDMKSDAESAIKFGWPGLTENHPHLSNPMMTENRFNFVPNDFTSFSSEGETENWLQLSSSGVHQLLSRSIATLLAQIHIETAHTNALNMLLEVATKFMTKIYHHPETIYKDEQKKNSHHFPNIAERILTTEGTGEIKNLHDYYQTSVMKYVEHVKQHCLGLANEFNNIPLRNTVSPVGINENLHHSNPNQGTISPCYRSVLWDDVTEVISRDKGEISKMDLLNSFTNESKYLIFDENTKSNCPSKRSMQDHENFSLNQGTLPSYDTFEELDELQSVYDNKDRMAGMNPCDSLPVTNKNKHSVVDENAIKNIIKELLNTNPPVQDHENFSLNQGTLLPVQYHENQGTLPPYDAFEELDELQSVYDNKDRMAGMNPCDSLPVTNKNKHSVVDENAIKNIIKELLNTNPPVQDHENFSLNQGTLLPVQYHENQGTLPPYDAFEELDELQSVYDNKDRMAGMNPSDSLPVTNKNKHLVFDGNTMESFLRGELNANVSIDNMQDFTFDDSLFFS